MTGGPYLPGRGVEPGRKIEYGAFLDVAGGIDRLPFRAGGDHVRLPSEPRQRAVSDRCRDDSPHRHAGRPEGDGADRFVFDRVAGTVKADFRFFVFAGPDHFAAAPRHRSPPVADVVTGYRDGRGGSVRVGDFHRADRFVGCRPCRGVQQMQVIALHRPLLSGDGVGGEIVAVRPGQHDAAFPVVLLRIDDVEIGAVPALPPRGGESTDRFRCPGRSSPLCGRRRFRRRSRRLRPR